MADLHHHNDGGRDWSSLPSDVLSTIAGDLLPLLDCLRFRSVCKSWCNSVPHVAMPLLILPTNTADSLTFCSLASLKTTFNSPAPPGVAGTHYVGSHDGWLALSGLAFNVFLFNPFTGDRIDLPPSTTILGFEVRLYCKPERQTKSHYCYVRKIVFNSSPTPQNLMAVAINMFGGITYTRAGEDKWNSISFGHGEVYDVMFHDGGFWAICGFGKLFAFDLRGKGLPEVSLAFDMFDVRSLRRFYEDAGLTRGDELLYGYKYLAVGNDGNIVIVFRDEGKDWTRAVVIEIVGPEFDQARRVRSLGHHCLFVGYNNGFSLPAEEGHQLRGNCVFINDTICDKSHVVYDMGVFDMENESFELMLPQCTKKCLTPSVIFMPSIKQNNLESTSGSNTLTVN